MSAALEFAKRYLEDLLSFFGLNTAVEATEEDNTIELNVPSSRLNGFLIGQRGESLRSLQHITNMALKRANFEDTAVVIDIADYKKQRNERLEQLAQRVAEEVKVSKTPKELEPMNAYERRVVHKTIGEIEGVESESAGEGYDRHIVIRSSENE